MKIRVTEIEANAEELRQSTSLSAAMTQALRRAFVPAVEENRESEEEDENE